MITSQAYKDAISSSSRTYRIEGVIGAHIFTDEHIRSGSFKIDNKAVNGSSLGFGACYVGLLEIELRDLPLDRFTAYGLEISADFILETATGEERIPLGRFNVIEAVNAPGGALALKAIDVMERLDLLLPGVSEEEDYESEESSTELIFIGEGTAYELLSQVCASAGVILANTQAEIEAMPNATRIFQILAGSAMRTWRDVAINLLALLGAFATINRAGQFEVRRFFAYESYEIDPDLITSSEAADTKTRFDAVSIVAGGRTFKVEVDEAEKRAGAATLELGDNQFAFLGADLDVQAMLLELLNYIKVIEYLPYSVSFFGDPSFELGASISVNTRSGLIQSVITEQEWTLRGEHRLAGVGENVATTGTSFSQREVESRLAEVSSAIIREKESIRLYVDAQDADTVSLIEQRSDQIMLSVSAGFVSNEELTGVEASLRSELELNASEMVLKFEEASARADAVSTSLAESIEERESYMRFSNDGLELGHSDSRFKANLSNSELAFMQDDERVAYLSDKKLYITDAEVKNSLILGRFAFVPRVTGNLSFVYIGGDS